MDINPATQCDLCKNWIHIDCENIGENQPQNQKESPLP